jgi:hypothetical protein
VHKEDMGSGASSSSTSPMPAAGGRFDQGSVVELLGNAFDETQFWRYAGRDGTVSKEDVEAMLLSEAGRLVSTASLGEACDSKSSR